MCGDVYLINFDLDSTSDVLGLYDTMTDDYTIYLKEIWLEFIKKGCTTEEKLIWDVIDIITHEELHKAIDSCVEDPDDVDEHTIYKYLVQL